MIFPEKEGPRNYKNQIFFYKESKMKIAIINDTHFGVRNDHQGFLDYMFQFFDEQFFPYLVENNIKTVFKF